MSKFDWNRVVLLVSIMYAFECRASDPTAEDLPCVRLEVSGATEQPDCNGLYVIDPQFENHCSGRQAWVRDEERDSTTPIAKSFLYYLEDGFDGWVLAKSSCLSWGNFMAKVRSDAQTPLELTDAWHEYSEAKRILVSSSIKVTCITRAEDLCALSPCLHGAKCFNGIKIFTCLCPSNFTGQRCEKAVNGHNSHSESGFVNRWSNVKLAIIVAALILGCGGVITVIGLCCHQRREIRQKGAAVREEVKRNIYIGSDINTYRLLKEEEAYNGLEDRTQEPLNV